MPEYSNALIHSSSPYLLQHAHNPVNWMPWGEAALEEAKKKDLPLLISIGYSACHWCHVMEHESFESEEVAAIMNKHFVCIKVDREERPDIDLVYMDAVQLMTGQGGWPLHCFALPDGRPFFGGTYFPKDHWMHILKNVHTTFQTKRNEVESYANQLLQGLVESNDMPVQSIPPQFTDEAVEAAVGRWQKFFDNVHGGREGSPKFPMPNNYQFLLHYGVSEGHKEVLDHVHLTLRMMAYGGIYDQIGGGFARYSTDAIWKVPHFEKMLYDNAQLMSLYSEAYAGTKDPLYLEVIRETSRFIERDLMDKDGACYSAIDADSEGVEGKFYLWSSEDISTLAGDDLPIIKAYYHLDDRGKWEHGRYILMRKGSDTQIARSLNVSQELLALKLSEFKSRALAFRAARIAPQTDDKSLTGWNAMTCTGLADAYMATADSKFLDLAKRTMQFLLKHQLGKDGGLYHSYKNGKSSLPGYLEDYAHLTAALIRMYEASFEDNYILEALKLARYVSSHFEKTDAGFYYFKQAGDGDKLFAEKAEIHDNVIPASNSVMATALFKLGRVFHEPAFTARAELMLAQTENQFARHPTSHSQWMRLMLYASEPFFEIAIVGENCEEKRRALGQFYLYNTVLCGGKNEGTLPILRHRLVPGQTLIYVCQNGSCKLPVDSVEEALALLRN